MMSSGKKSLNIEVWRIAKINGNRLAIVGVYVTLLANNSNRSNPFLALTFLFATLWYLVILLLLHLNIFNICIYFCFRKHLQQDLCTFFIWSLMIASCLRLCSSTLPAHLPAHFTLPFALFFFLYFTLSSLESPYSPSSILIFWPLWAFQTRHTYLKNQSKHPHMRRKHVFVDLGYLVHNGCVQLRAITWEIYLFIFLNIWIILHCVNILHFHYPFVSWWKSRLFQFPGYYE